MREIVFLGAAPSPQLPLDQPTCKGRAKDGSHLSPPGCQPGAPAIPEENRPPGRVRPATTQSLDRLARQPQAGRAVQALPVVVRAVFPLRGTVAEMRGAGAAN